ncbi:C10 family peptidase [Flavobacterium anhuiense]|uniref:C10 family peptidase n=1 Tax=Flavobacterium anhuiense TaxID=459526 RepID=UPI0024E1E5EB|nr:C10 family peptidase [Flavobacterium anhuiense]
MKKNQKMLSRLSYLAFASLMLFLNSCQSDGDSQAQTKVDSHLISQEDAIKLAENLNSSGQISSQTSKSTSKKVGYAFTRFTKKKDAAFYILNYENGGFAIISADDRNTPVLAYSETSTFKNDTLNYPEGLKMWLEFQIKNVETIKIKNEALSVINKREWSPASKIVSNKKLTARVEPDDPTTCPPDQTETVGPLLSTTWGQNYGYNTLVPLICGSSPAPTGCVATAMAQVMKYYQKPASYNWANMPATYGTITTAGLMVDIGAAVSMSYGCEGSAANSEQQIAQSFTVDFHYSNATVGT